MNTPISSVVEAAGNAGQAVRSVASAVRARRPRIPAGAAPGAAGPRPNAGGRFSLSGNGQTTVEYWRNRMAADPEGAVRELQPVLDAHGMGGASAIERRLAVTERQDANPQGVQQHLFRAFRNYRRNADGSFSGTAAGYNRDGKGAVTGRPEEMIRYTFIPDEANGSVGRLILESNGVQTDDVHINLRDLPVAATQYRVSPSVIREANGTVRQIQGLNNFVIGLDGGNADVIAAIRRLGTPTRQTGQAQAAAAEAAQQLSPEEIKTKFVKGLFRDPDDLIQKLDLAQFAGRRLYDPTTKKLSYGSSVRTEDGQPVSYQDLLEELARQGGNKLDKLMKKLTNELLSDLAVVVLSTHGGTGNAPAQFRGAQKPVLKALSERFGVELVDANNIEGNPELISIVNRTNTILRSQHELANFGGNQGRMFRPVMEEVPSADGTRVRRVPIYRPVPFSPGRTEIVQEVNPDTQLFDGIMGRSTEILRPIMLRMARLAKAKTPGTTLGEHSTSTHSYPLVADLAFRNPGNTQVIRTKDGRIVMTLLNPITYGDAFNALHLVEGNPNYFDSVSREVTLALSRDGKISDTLQRLWFGSNFRGDTSKGALTKEKLREIKTIADREGIPVIQAIEIESILRGPLGKHTPMPASWRTNVEARLQSEGRNGEVTYRPFLDEVTRHADISVRVKELRDELAQLRQNHLTGEGTVDPVLANLENYLVEGRGDYFRPLLSVNFKKGGLINYLDYTK